MDHVKTDDDEHAALIAFFTQLGASAASAPTLATQLSKRATQLAAERGFTRTEALRYLLERVAQGRRGETPP